MFQAIRIGIAGAAFAAVLTFPLPTILGASHDFTVLCTVVLAMIAFVIGSGMELSHQRSMRQQHRLYERLRRMASPSNN